jgi:lipooligosaccharide transport system ATP-binding protein
VARSILSVRKVYKSYGSNPVVNGVSFELERGKCFGLLGPNGAGKTTTLRLCLGLTEADQGEITLLDQPVPLAARQARIRVGIVPQIDNLDPDFSVEENLLVYGRYFRLSDKLIRERIPALLEFAGLGNRGGAKLLTLSGGMKRRLTLARALINDPDLIFLDEPTTGLDPQARHLIWERLRRLLNQGKTIVLTTHFMDEAERLCDRLLIMDHGRSIAEGAPRSLIASNIEPQVVEVYGENVGDWLASRGTKLSERSELTGETAFCYTRDPQPLLDDLQNEPGLRYLHRAANLEDVFLKLTGREMRD